MGAHLSSLRSCAQLWPRLLLALVTYSFAAALSYDLSNCWCSFLFPSQVRSVLVSVVVGPRFSSFRRCAQFWHRLFWVLVTFPFAPQFLLWLIWALISLTFAVALTCVISCCWQVWALVTFFKASELTCVKCCCGRVCVFRFCCSLQRPVFFNVPLRCPRTPKRHLSFTKLLTHHPMPTIGFDFTIPFSVLGELDILADSIRASLLSSAVDS